MRTELTEARSQHMESQQKVRACQQQVLTKQKMLADFTREKQTAQGKVESIKEVLGQSEANLEKIHKMIAESPAMQLQQELREEYLEIRSNLQTENASLERQTCKLESQIQMLLEKQKANLADIKKLEGQLAAQTSQPQLQAQLDQINAKTQQHEKYLAQA